MAKISESASRAQLRHHGLKDVVIYSPIEKFGQRKKITSAHQLRAKAGQTP
jgi:hypothetical protein